MKDKNSPRYKPRGEDYCIMPNSSSPLAPFIAMRRKGRNTALSEALQQLDVEADRTEAVVAAYHGTHGVLHPAIVEVALALG